MLKHPLYPLYILLFSIGLSAYSVFTVFYRYLTYFKNEIHGFSDAVWYILPTFMLSVALVLVCFVIGNFLKGMFGDSANLDLDDTEDYKFTNIYIFIGVTLCMIFTSMLFVATLGFHDISHFSGGVMGGFLLMSIISGVGSVVGNGAIFVITAIFCHWLNPYIGVKEAEELRPVHELSMQSTTSLLRTKISAMNEHELKTSLNRAVTEGNAKLIKIIRDEFESRAKK